MAVAPARSDAALVARLRSRDRSAWEDVYRLYGDRLYRFAFSLTGNPHDAADLVQETFVRALPRLDQLDPERLDLSAYLLATEKNLFLKSVERSRRQEPVEVVPEPVEPSHLEDDPERSSLLARQQVDVRRANAALAPRQRLVLALRELEDRSYAEIGELVGLNENAVAQLISRARQRLREEMRLVQVDRSKLPEECQGFLPLLSAQLDGQLRGVQAERTLAHLEGCETCQAALADMREASRLYRALLPIPFPELMGRIDDALASSAFWVPGRGRDRVVPRRRRSRIATGAAIGGATIAVAVGGVLVGRGGSEPAAAEAAGDRDPPRLALPADTLTREATSASGARVVYAVEAEDDVDGALAATCAPAAGDVFPIGATEVTCTAQDAAGNRAEGSFRVEVVDTTAPALLVPEAVEVEARGPEGATVSFRRRARDRVDEGATIRCSPPAGASFPLGTTSVQCVARDAAGNERRRSFSVTVRDTSPPELIVPEALDVEAGGRLVYEASARDAVDGEVAWECSLAPGAVLPVGTTEVECTSEDRSGNVARAAFTVGVSDTQAPRLRLPRDLRVEALGPRGRRIGYTVSARDAVDGPVAPRCSPRPRTLFPLGTTEVTCTASDAKGNRATGSFRIRVVDTTPPRLTLPSSPTVEATARAGAPVTFEAAALDRVDGGLATTCSPASGTTFPLGTTTVRCSARDRSGNETQGTFRVTVADTTPPELTVPANRTVQATSASGATVTYSATATDLVDGAIAPGCAPASGSVFPVGATTVTCTARDVHGNEQRGSFTVTVTPLPRPDLVVRAVTGTSFTISNVGTAPAGPFVVTVQGVGTFTFAGLAPGASATRNVSCASIQRLVTIDPANQVAESNEQNNTARIPAC